MEAPAESLEDLDQARSSDDIEDSPLFGNFVVVVVVVPVGQ